VKFTLSWLKDHLETEAGLGEICDTLTAIGLELEGVEDKAAGLEPFTVGYVIEAKPHPDADRLRVCRVATAEGEVQVVCGAPNARTGMKGVFAPAGVTVPGTGVELTSATIRGVDSNGMLCSEREMGLSDEHDGIIELPEDAPVGASFAAIAGLDDPVVDVAITPNRQDCTGVHGIARDLAAAGLGTLKPFDESPVEGAFDSPVAWHRDFAPGHEGACPMVVGRSFRNIVNGPSPAWMQARLRAIGLRPISALVDITNYVTMDLGRPLHVFDAAKIGGALVMRMAKAGETVLALDGRDYALTPEMTVIAEAGEADSPGAVRAIGGIMGGEETGVTEATTEVFLEVALFDPIRTAATGRALGIESDARYRFERGVDPRSALWGAEVAARLILALCGGEASALTIAGEMPEDRRTVDLRPGRVESLGGVAVAPADQRRILDALGFETEEAGDAIRATVPTWRQDIGGEADLVEEVLRIRGYDAIPPVSLSLDGELPGLAIDLSLQRARRARRALAQRGMVEAVTWSFMPSGRAAGFRAEDAAALPLANPISADLDEMRPSILPNLLAAAARNAARGHGDIALFEVGPQYADATPEGQSRVAAGVIAGLARPRHWTAKARPADAFDAKAAALAALDAAGAPVDKLQITTDAPGWYHPGRSGVFRLGPNILAAFGEIHPRTLREMELRGGAAGFEVFLDAVPVPRSKDSGKARPLLRPSPFQPVVRDFAFVMAADVPAEKALRAARSSDKDLVTDVEAFDVYTGENVGAGEKSLALVVTLQPVEATLTDDRIEAVAKKIVAAVEKATGGTLRG
jgi:phenylalanyl-tRNA synthetase beta chain